MSVISTIIDSQSSFPLSFVKNDLSTLLLMTSAMFPSVYLSCLYIYTCPPSKLPLPVVYVVWILLLLSLERAGLG